MNERLHLRIRGVVQGVNFRASARQRARLLGLTGWVRNEPEGTVEALAEGPPSALDAFWEWCQQGPPAAEVGVVDVLTRATAAAEFQTFDIRR